MRIQKFANIGKSILILLNLLTALALTTAAQNGAREKPTIAVLDFDMRGVNAPWDVGRVLSDMLVNALVESGRFRVLERTNLNPVHREQFMALNGSVDPASGAAVGKLIGARYLVLSSVKEFRQRNAGIGPLRIKIPGAGGLTAYEGIVKFNLRVIDSTTGEIVFSQQIEKKQTAAGLGDGTLYGVEIMQNYRSEAMQSAVQGAMNDTVEAVSRRLGSIEPLPNEVAVEAKQAATADCSAFTDAKAPRLMVVIPEIHISRSVPDPAGETEIIKKLVERRFKVVDQKQIDAIRNREKVLAAVKNPAAAAALGVEFGADIIIIGEAFSELATRQGNMVSTRARVEARAIQTNNARILAADGKHGSAADTAELVAGKAALRSAGSQLADYFITQLCRVSSRGETASSSPTSASMPNLASEIEIFLTGVTFAQLGQFTGRLEKIPGVSKLQKTFTGNTARVTVEYAAGGEKLADAISAAKFGTLPVNIVGLASNKIEIKIGK